MYSPYLSKHRFDYRMEFCIKRAAVRAPSPVGSPAVWLQWCWCCSWAGCEALIRARPRSVLGFEEHRSFLRASGEGWSRRRRPAGAGIPVELDRGVNSVVMLWWFAVSLAVTIRRVVGLSLYLLSSSPTVPGVLGLTQRSAGGDIALFGPAGILTAAYVPVVSAAPGSPVCRCRCGFVDQWCGGFAFGNGRAHVDLQNATNSQSFRVTETEIERTSARVLAQVRIARVKDFAARARASHRSLARSLFGPSWRGMLIERALLNFSFNKGISLSFSLCLSQDKKLRQTAWQSHWRI